MSVFYASVSAGGRVIANANGARIVQFDADAPINVPTFSNGVAINPAGTEALLRGNNDRTYVIRRYVDSSFQQVQDVGSSAGTQNVGYAPDGRRCYITTPNTFVFGTEVRAVPRDAGNQLISGQGWTYVTNDGPAWTAFVGHRVVDGTLMARCLDVNGFVIGMDTNPKLDRILAYDAINRQWWTVWTGQTPIGPDAALVNGQIVVAISVPGLFVEQSKWTRRVDPVTPPKPPTPKPEPPDEDDDMADSDSLARLKRIEQKLDQVLDALDELPNNPPSEPGTPDPPPSDPEVPTIPIEAVTWLNSGNPLDFRVTSHIRNVTIEKKKDDKSTPYTDDNFQVCFPHTKAGEWPELTNADGVKYEGNVCVFARINSRWYGAAAEWLKVNQTCKRFSNRSERDSWGIGPHTKKEPMRSWGPKSGEWIGIMVCTPVRDGVEGDALERSNIHMVRWP